MGKFAVNLLLLCFLAGFGVFFGMEAASRGIERIYGPLEPSFGQTGGQEARMESLSPEKPPVPPSAWQTPEERENMKAEKIPAIEENEGLAEKAGQLLQTAALGLIRFVASLFDRFI